MDSLPTEVFEYLLNYIDSLSTARLACVNKKFRRIGGLFTVKIPTVITYQLAFDHSIPVTVCVNMFNELARTTNRALIGKTDIATLWKPVILGDRICILTSEPNVSFFKSIIDHVYSIEKYNMHRTCVLTTNLKEGKRHWLSAHNGGPLFVITMKPLERLKKGQSVSVKSKEFDIYFNTHGVHHTSIDPKVVRRANHEDLFVLYQVDYAFTR